MTKTELCFFLDFTVKRTLKVFTIFTFNNKIRKRKNRSEWRVDKGGRSNHEPLDPKSLSFQLSHEELDDFRGSKSLFLFQPTSSVHVAPGQDSNYKKGASSYGRKTLYLTHPITQARMSEINILFSPASSISAIVFPSLY